MKQILHSLHGRLLGTSSDGRLVLPNGSVQGDGVGSQWADEGPARCTLTADFLGAAMPGSLGLLKGSDGATVNFAIVAGLSGMARAVTGAGAGGTMAVNGVQASAQLNFEADSGELEFEARIKLSAITNISVFVGLTNQVAALQAPAIGAGGGDTFTLNANDACGFIFDTTMTTQKWWLYGAAGGVQATQQNSTFAPVIGAYERFHISVDGNGKATFYRNGLQVGVSMAGAVTKTVPLSPVVAAFTRTAASANIDLDYIHASCTRV